MKRHLDHAEAIDRLQLAARFGQRSTHAGKRQVTLKESLIRDLRERRGVAGAFALFLELDQAVQSVRPHASGRDAPRRFVDDLDPALAHEVMPVALVEMQRGERRAYRLLAMHPVAPQAVRRDALEELALRPGQLRAHAAAAQNVMRILCELGSESERFFEIALFAAVRAA